MLLKSTTVRGVVSTRYQLSMHTYNIWAVNNPCSKCQKSDKNKFRSITKAHTYLQTMTKTPAKLKKKKKTSTIVGVVSTRYLLSILFELAKWQLKTQKKWQIITSGIYQMHMRIFRRRLGTARDNVPGYTTVFSRVLQYVPRYTATVLNFAEVIVRLPAVVTILVDMPTLTVYKFKNCLYHLCWVLFSMKYWFTLYIVIEILN